MKVFGFVFALVLIGTTASAVEIGITSESSSYAPGSVGGGLYATFNYKHLVITPRVLALAAPQTTYSSTGAIVSTSHIWAVAPSLLLGYALRFDGMALETTVFAAAGSNIQLQTSTPAVFDPFRFDVGVNVALPAGRVGKIGMGAAVPILRRLPDHTWKWIDAPDLLLSVRIGLLF